LNHLLVSYHLVHDKSLHNVVHEFYNDSSFDKPMEYIDYKFYMYVRFRISFLIDRQQ
jgi:hypothetical protein